MDNWTGICYYFDCGWCYHPSEHYPNGCVGSDKCKYYNECKESK